MEHDAYTSKLYKENWDDAVEKLNEADRFLEDALNALNWHTASGFKSNCSRKRHCE